MVVLDTCAIIELCRSKPALSSEALATIDQGAVILSISFAEIACKIKIGKLYIGMSSEELLSHYKALPRIDIIDISADLWHKAISLDWKHKDPADRIIVAYAVENMCSIVTSDKLITAFYKKVIWKSLTILER